MTQHWYYWAAIVVLFLMGGYLLRRYMFSLEKIRRKRLNKTKTSEFLASNINKNVAKVKQQYLNSLEKRFSITKRALYLLLIFTALLIALIPVLGKISPTLISVIVGGISIILGIAAKPFIENLICGLVLCFGKLARIGDIVLVDDQYGTIEDVTLTHCVIRRWDWLRYVVPNSQMMTKEFLNYSLRDNHRWVHVEFWVDYKTDLELVERIAKDSPQQSKYFSSSEHPRFWIVDLTPESVKCMVVAWATTAADGWMLSIDIRRNLLGEFQRHGIATHLQNVRVKGMEQVSKEGS